MFYRNFTQTNHFGFESVEVGWPAWDLCQLCLQLSNQTGRYGVSAMASILDYPLLHDWESARKSFQFSPQLSNG